MIVTKDNVTINDFNRICRTCLSTQNLEIISEAYHSNIIPIQYILNTYTQVKVNSTDNLPKKMCSECVKNLISAYTFLKNCELINQVLIECCTSMCNESNFQTNDDQPNFNPPIFIKCEIKEEPQESLALEDYTSGHSVELSANQLINPIKIDALHTDIEINDDLQDLSNDWNIHKYDSSLTATSTQSNVNAPDERTTSKKHVAKRKLVKCTVCSKEVHKSSLTKHLRIHKKGKLHTCDKCNAKFSFKSAYARHIGTNCSEIIEKNKCYECNLTFPTRGFFMEHNKVVHNNKYKCKICEKKFKGGSSLREHLRVHTGETYKCEICKKSYYTSRRFSKHMKTHDPKNDDDNDDDELRAKIFKDDQTPRPKILTGFVKCPLCGREILKKSLNRHMRIHNKRKLYQCEKCNAKFSFKSAYARHVGANCSDVIEKNKCFECDVIFPTRGYFVEHNRIVHNNKFKCKICEKKFKGGISFREHLRIHTGETYKCEICEKTYNTNKCFSKHMRTHNPQYDDDLWSPFFKADSRSDPNIIRPLVKCTICSKEVHKSSLTKHLRIHSKRNLYTCEKCNAKFSFKSAYARHVGTNCSEEIEKNKCFECDLTFPTRPVFVEHNKVIHNNKFKCKVCDKEYTGGSALREHLRIHTGETYKCEICEKSYFTSRCFNKHMRTHNTEYEVDLWTTFFGNEGGSTSKETRLRVDCTICSKQIYKSSMKKHMRMHDNRELQQCEKCNATFSFKAEYARHVAANCNEVIEKNKCYECELTFPNRPIFVEHNKVVHNNEFICKVCDKKFPGSATLKEHLRIHTGDAYNCEICGKAYYTSRRFSKHMKTHIT